MFEKVNDIAASETENLAELASLVGADKNTFFVGTDFSNANLSGVNLSRYNIYKSVFDATIVDEKTKIRNPGDFRYLYLVHVIFNHKIFADVISDMFKSWFSVFDEEELDGSKRELLQRSTEVIPRFQEAVNHTFERNLIGGYGYKSHQMYLFSYKKRNIMKSNSSNYRDFIKSNANSIEKFYIDTLFSKLFYDRGGNVKPLSREARSIFKKNLSILWRVCKSGKLYDIKMERISAGGKERKNKIFRFSKDISE